MAIILFMLLYVSGSNNFVLGENSAPNLTTGSGNFIIGDYLGRDITTQNCQIRIGKIKLNTRYESVTLLGMFLSIERIDKFCKYPKGKLLKAFDKVQVY